MKNNLFMLTIWSIASLLCLSITTSSPSWAGFQEGLTALEEGNYAKAVSLFTPLAEDGNFKAQFNLGLCYHKGKGGLNDPQRAAMWYRLAAGKGDPRAQYNLGLMYMKGAGVGEDYSQAGRWFLQAAQQGYARAQYNLSIMYNEGLGRPLNYSKAMQWNFRAKRNGFVKGKNNLDHLGFTRTLADFYKSD